MSMIRHVLLTFTALICFCASAFAQQAVNVRTGAHSGYTRAVFDWTYNVPYETQQISPDEILVSFFGAADMNIGEKGHGVGTDILDVKQISSDGTNLQVVIKTSPGRNFRHFTVGNKVVIDVSDPNAVKQALASSPAPQAIPTRKKVEAAPAKTPEKKAAEKPVKITQPAPQKMPAVKPVPVEEEIIEVEEEQSLIEQAAPVLDPHVVTISSTETVGMAAFRRSDWLWIVLDRPTLNVPPQLAGEQADSFGPFQRVELKGGVAYRTKMPPGHKNMYFYGEGGGLVWRIVITPNKRDVKPVEMTRSFMTTKFVRGGTATWPFRATTKVLDLPDPSIGDILKVVTVQQADQFSGRTHNLVDFNTLHTVVGLALQPEVDDLDVSLTSSGVEITRPAGLALSRMKDISRRLMRQQVQEVVVADEPAEPGQEIRRIFDFDRWMMGGLQALEENQRILLSGMAVKDSSGRVQDLLTLAKMNVSNDRGQEALGFLAYAADELPDIADSPEFRALKGASAALAGKFELAFNELWHPTLTDYTELDYWRAFTLAALEDWQQAVETMPDDFTVLISYPRPLLEKIGLKLAEVALRAGKVETTEGILAVLQKERESLRSWTVAGMDYLKGEAHRQSNEYENARQWWDPLRQGQDDWYRARAGLALTMLELQNGDLTIEQAIDRLEGLRYTWRGDELEAQTNFLLGKLYIEQDRYLKGFTILRDATGMNPDSDIGKEITAYMQEEFRDLLLNDEDLTPLEAVEVYEEFRELTPTGDEGNKLVQKLAERLVQADLLGRAADILQHQTDFRLQGEEKARVAVRLGAIYLIDKKARAAMKYLAQGRDIYGRILEGAARAAKLREIDLLRARGLSQLNRTEEAIEMLRGFPPDPDVNKLRADIAWQSGLWEDAAEALQDLILDQALDLNRPLTPQQADLILNYSVALNLSGNRVALNNTRRRYEDSMKRTARARLFDVVTRPRNTSILADRETIESIVNEVDMFQEFLESYRTDAEAISN